MRGIGRTGRVITVFGSSRTPAGTPAWRQAYELGRDLAQAGWTIVNGGYGGTMEAVSRGAREAGGYIIGVTCADFDPLPPNPWLNEERRKPSLFARLMEIITLGDAYIALPGGIGTLSEVTLVWSLFQAGSLPSRPLILIGSSWARLVEAFARHTEMDDGVLGLARLAADTKDAIRLLSTFFQGDGNA
ncbi:MAG: LOG family protein [Anaerolineae bacterium]|nr:LOG family protein [Anaerolineae bacterium]MDW8100182.1 LOG family protein [Anaerolineae bacterium]